MPELLERLATLESNYSAIDRRSDEHERNDEERFERTMLSLFDMKKDIMGTLTGMENKLDLLWDIKNKQEGASKNRAATWASFIAVAGMVVEGLAIIFKK